ncbi:hypothetical protein [Nitrobacter sp. JJSN]|uniref:hypothetical protein n=1 Tax=Nitrobacter sp. JJSN TaxID=3453033 RepID=UPI003F763E1A
MSERISDVVCGDSLEWWENPLSSEGYKYFFITQGSWKNDTFVIPIDCVREQRDQRELWECSINKAVWVRVIADEFYDAGAGKPKLPNGPFRAPFFRIISSSHAPIYDEFLKDTGAMKSVGPVREYFISSMENEIHFLAMEEPVFKRLAK